MVMAGLLAAILAACLFPSAVPKSDDQCARCHGNYRQYLDIIEGDSENRIPSSIDNSQVLNVTVVIKNECNAAKYNTISSISASLVSVNGLFRTLANPVSLGSLNPGQTRLATWRIEPVASGQDILRITVQGLNTHESCHYADSYSPDPFITVGVAAANAPPSISIIDPAPGLRASGGLGLNVGWNIMDEDRASCLVDLYYSTDGFANNNTTIATRLPPDQPYNWTLPRIDSPNILLKAIVVDSKGNRNETTMPGPFSVDSTPPAILSVEPPEGTVNVSEAALIVVRFSEPVVTGSVEAAFGLRPDPGGTTWNWDPDRSTLIVTHAPFLPGTRYSCSLSPGSTDRSVPGNPERAGLNWSFFTSDTFIPIPSISISSPHIEDRFYQGQTIPVSWTATGGVGTLRVNISLSSNGTQGTFSTVEAGLANDGTFGFIAPDVVSDRCTLAVSVVDQNGTESIARTGLFSISQPIALEAVFPPGGMTFLANRSLDISWSATGGHRAVSVRILFQQDPDSGLRTAASMLPRTGNYRWTVPTVDSVSARLFVNATDEWNGSAERTSLPFTIMSVDPDLPLPPAPPPDRPPVVIFNIRENTVQAKKNVTFDASGSFDPELDRLYYVWDFGDGSGPENTTDPVVYHMFAEKGRYEVHLTVGDTRDQSDQTVELEVAGPPLAPPDRFQERMVLVLGISSVILGCVGTAWAALSRPGSG
jgi:hypothetical protein